MHLDMQTMSAVNVTVTAILGGVLLFTWARERDSAFVGWWGLALVIMSAGVILSSFPVRPHADLLHLGLATRSPTPSNGRRHRNSRSGVRASCRFCWVQSAFSSPSNPVISIPSITSWACSALFSPSTILPPLARLPG